MNQSKHMLIAGKKQTLSSESPPWIELLPQTVKIKGEEDEHTLDKQSCTAIINDFDSYSNDMVIDYEHQTLSGNQAPAAGWITKLERKENKAIWGKVSWTEAAKAYIAKREYRYISPVYYAEKATRKIVGLYNVALTNQPRMKNVRAIVAKHQFETPEHLPGKETYMFDDLKKELGLSPETDEAQLEIAVMKETVRLKEKLATQAATVAKELVEALGADSNTVSVCKAHIEALKQRARVSDDSLADVAALKAKMLKQDVEKIVAKAMKEGKITPEQKEWATKYGTDDLAGLTLFVSKAVAVIPIGGVQSQMTTPPASQNGHSPETIEIAKQLGISVDDLDKYGQTEVI